MANDPLNLGGLDKEQQAKDAELKDNLLEFLTLSYTSNKSPEQLSRQVELATYLGSIGLASPEKSKYVSQLLSGTPFDASLVQQTMLASADPNSADVGALLSGALNTSTSRDIRSKTDTTTVTNRTQTQYVDLPTPEEFLDDFDNAFGMHVEGLVQTGALRPEVAEFAMNNRSMFFREYLREQVGRLLKGEPLWKTVGTNAQERLIGTRRGDFSRDQGTSQQTSTATSSATQSATPSETPEGKAIESTANETERRTEDNKFDNTLNVQEAIVERNRLAVVANLAPLDFLKGSAEAKRLNLLYGGQKGAAQRQAATATGQDFSGAARRI